MAGQNQGDSVTVAQIRKLKSDMDEYAKTYNGGFTTISASEAFLSRATTQTEETHDNSAYGKFAEEAWGADLSYQRGESHIGLTQFLNRAESDAYNREHANQSPTADSVTPEQVEYFKTDIFYARNGNAGIFDRSNKHQAEDALHYNAEKDGAYGAMSREALRAYDRGGLDAVDKYIDSAEKDAVSRRDADNLSKEANLSSDQIQKFRGNAVNAYNHGGDAELSDFLAKSAQENSKNGAFAKGAGLAYKNGGPGSLMSYIDNANVAAQNRGQSAPEQLHGGPKKTARKTISTQQNPKVKPAANNSITDKGKDAAVPDNAKPKLTGDVKKGLAPGNDGLSATITASKGTGKDLGQVTAKIGGVPNIGGSNNRKSLDAVFNAGKEMSAATAGTRASMLHNLSVAGGMAAQIASGVVSQVQQHTDQQQEQR